MQDKPDIDTSAGLADLHVHTVISDGSFTAEQIVEMAAAAGLRAISITDHDTTAGILPARVAAEAHGLEVISGIELSSFENDVSIHILGYFIDIEDQNLLGFLDLFHENRIRRAKRIVDKLHKLGIQISFDLVWQKAGPGSIGRPHIAEVLLEDGFVLSFEEAFIKYLATGRPAYEPNYPLALEDAIHLVHQAGGISFIAHPDLEVIEKRLTTLIRSGLDGIEILHPRFDESVVRRLYNIAIENELLVSGGSDFHGYKDGLCHIGQHTVPYRFVEDMKQKLLITKNTSAHN